MRDLGNSLRPLLVAVLTLALLIGPCLSLVGMSAGAAHAHASSVGASHDLASSRVEHHHASTQSGHKENHHPGPQNSGLSCEELCEGWAVRTSHNSPDNDGDIAPQSNYKINHLFLLAATDAIPAIGIGERPPAYIFAGLTHLSALPPYALTKRYRL